jgi:c(7)-type cytochrome triheme protein
MTAPSKGSMMPRFRRIASLVALLSASWAVTALATSPIDILGNVTMNRRSTNNGVPAVVFPHWKHRSRFRCYACHPEVFEMQSGANDVTMSALQAGEFCGRCHDGKEAFPIGFDTCRDCHSLIEP